jgi:prepilin-type processing-associated H-X9-DG protein
VGPTLVTRAITMHHNQRGHLLFGDFHVERLAQKQFDPIVKTRRFWFPTDDTTGPGGMQMGTGLSP